MVQTITPAVSRGRREWWISALVYTLGTVVTASLFGALLGAAGLLLGVAGRARLGAAIVAVVALLYALHEGGFLRLPTPQSFWQVPRSWRGRFSLPVVSFLFGLLLGPGFTIRITSPSYYALVLAAFFFGRPALGLGLFALYGLARSSGVWLLSRESHRTSDDLCHVTDQVQRVLPVARSVASLILASAAGFVAAVLL